MFNYSRLTAVTPNVNTVDRSKWAIHFLAQRKNKYKIALRLFGAACASIFSCNEVM